MLFRPSIEQLANDVLDRHFFNVNVLDGNAVEQLLAVEEDGSVIDDHHPLTDPSKKMDP